MYKDRREFLEKLLDGQELVGIEIGALDRPLVNRADLTAGNKIFYADHLSTESLKEKYKLDNSVDLTALVDVDLISSDGSLLDCLDGQMVDYIVASHVVEHVPNPIHWFQMLFETIRPGGFVFLVVPDKRYTFDYQRPVTTFGEILQAFLLEKNIPSVSDVYDHYSSAVMIDGGKVWSGLLGPGDLVPLTSNENAYKYAHEVHFDHTYHDVHVSIFTPQSFFSIIERMIHSDLLFPEVSEFSDTRIDDIEFMVALRKPITGSPNVCKETCLASIPKLEFESFMSPYMPQVKSLSAALDKTTEVAYGLQRELEKLRGTIEEQNEEKIKLLKQLLIAQKVLDRKSVKIVTGLLHKTFGFFR
jgi:hypothetical protein